MAKVETCLEACARAFDQTPYYAVPDRVLTRTFNNYPRNDSMEDILPKVVLLNVLYATQIYDWYRVAMHLREQQLDAHLSKGDVRVVERVRKGHRITTKTGLERDFYSFATKYCHWHRPDTYPMFDRYVSVALQRLNRKLHFSPPFSDENLRDYSVFLGAVNAFRSILQRDWRGYKRLDQALWVLGQCIEGEADKGVVRAIRKQCAGVY